MRILFISNYFPGDLGPLARVLAASSENEVLFASSRQRKDYALPDVRLVRLKNAPLFGNAPPAVSGLWEEAIKRGSAGLRSLRALRDSWGEPDMVFASLSGGAAFFAPEAFPGAFFVAYAEAGQKNFPLLPRAVRTAWILLQSDLFSQVDLCFALSEQTRSLFPRPLQQVIRLTAPCVDTETFSRAAARPWFDAAAPGDAAAGPLLTLDATGLEGAPLARLLRLGHAVLRALSDCHVVMLVENRRLKEAVETAVAVWPADVRERFAACNSLPFERYRDLLAASSLMVCPGCGDAAERSMLECMSCETLLMARAASASFLHAGINMLELPAHEPLAAVLAALDGRRGGIPAEPAPQARRARRDVLEYFSEAVVVPRHLAEVMRARDEWKRGRRLGVLSA